MADYMTRAMRANDKRYAKILGKIARHRPKLRVKEDMTALRAEYQETVGKKPYMGWDAATLRQKMAEAAEG